MLHRLSNVTQVLAGVNALCALDPAGRELADRAADVAAASSAAEDLGWALGALGAALGADALFDRRHAGGAAELVRLTAEACRREGRDVPCGEPELARLEPLLERGWRDVWCLCRVLHAASGALPPGARLGWSLGEDGALALRGPSSPPSAELCDEVPRDARLAGDGSGWVLAIGGPALD